MKQFEQKVGMRFLNNYLVVGNNDCLTKIANVYVVYDLDFWPRHPLYTYNLKGCLFGANNIVKKFDAFDGFDSWSFGRLWWECHNFWC